MAFDRLVLPNGSVQRVNLHLVSVNSAAIKADSEGMLHPALSKKRLAIEVGGTALTAKFADDLAEFRRTNGGRRGHSAANRRRGSRHVLHSAKRQRSEALAPRQARRRIRSLGHRVTRIENALGTCPAFALVEVSADARLVAFITPLGNCPSLQKIVGTTLSMACIPTGARRPLAGERSRSLWITD